MTNRMVGSVLTLMTLLFSAGGGAAQTYTQMQWGMNKGVTPYTFGANINGTWRDLGTVTSAGVWAIPSSNLTFTQSGAGATTRTVSAKLRDQISVKDFGAVCNGVTDDTAAFAAAIAAVPPLGGSVTIPTSSASCVLNNLNINKSVELIGDGGPGPGAATISPITATATAITVSAQFVSLRNITFAPKPGVAKQTGGVYINTTSGANRLTLSSLTLQEYYSGISINGSPASLLITDIRAFLYSTSDGVSQAAITINGGIDQQIRGCSIFGPGTAGSDNSLVVTATSDLLITGCNIAGTKIPMLVNPGNGQQVNSLWVEDSFFDTSTTGVKLIPSGTGLINRSRFSNAWFSSHTNVGLEINAGVNGIEITNSHTLDNDVYGIELKGGQNIVINGGQFAGNTVAAVYVAPGVSRWAVKNAIIGPSSGFGANGTGVFVDTGASNYYDITNNIMQGNTTAAIADNGTGRNKSVYGNHGDPSTYEMFRNTATGALNTVGFESSFSAFSWFVNGSASPIFTLENSGRAIFTAPQKLASYTFSTLPTCNAGAEGSLIYVSDSNVTSGAITGTGANKVMGLCDGANWTAH